MAKQESINEMELDTVDFCSKCYSLKIKYEDSIGMDCCEDCGCTDFKTASFDEWEKLYKEGYIIVADRYTTSNGVHQCSKLPKEEWNDFMDWLYDFEYSKMGIPAPDGVIYLNMSPEHFSRIKKAIEK
mgnify:CR=1 FL=1